MTYLKGSTWVFALLLSCFFASELHAQKRPISYFNGAYQIYSKKEDGLNFKLFDFNISSGSIRTEYFGYDSENRYNFWRKSGRKNVLCYFAVGFVQTWEPSYLPLGLAADKGKILNKAIEPNMDALVSVSPAGQVSVLDIKAERMYGKYALRTYKDRANFLSQIPYRKTSIFQTQLMYSIFEGNRMGPRDLGKKSSRRFLAICKGQRNDIHHIVLDLVASAHLNRAAQAALGVLRKKGYEVIYLVNQDTGYFNIMGAFDARGNKIYVGPVDLSKAAQILVYYWDN